jgi:hypothetical protein
MIASANNGPRKEIKIESGGVMAIGQPVVVYSALYGDGTERYANVTEIVQGFGDTWPENWEELVYGSRKASMVAVSGGMTQPESSSLVIHRAYYGIPDGAPTFVEPPLDVTATLQAKVVGGSLDLSVTNAELGVGNPFRGHKKRLWVQYAYDGGAPVEVTKDERDWLIIGQSARYVKGAQVSMVETDPSSRAFSTAAQAMDRFVEAFKGIPPETIAAIDKLDRQQSPQALNDLLIRRFAISSHRLRGPMPIEVPTFHRNDLATLFAELGFNRGAEIGVAEANYSEVLVKANPQLELLCVDPWHAYSGNKQQKSKEKHEYAYNEATRKLAGSKARLIMKTSAEAVVDVPDGSLDFIYIDGNHSFNYVMLDLICWSAKVRSGGLITGDDFYYLDPNRWGAGPVEAVMAYTSAHKINPWFTFMGHKSIDYCWVKQ